MSDVKKVLDHMAVKRFVREHSDYYSSWERSMIYDYISRGSRHAIFTEDIVREIYDELGLIPEDENMYVSFLNLIEDNFELEGKNIVEVGGGILPRLGRRIHLKQNTGTITIYDPRLAEDIKEEDRFFLKREEFKRDTPLENVDLLIGLMPCQGAEPLITQATNHNIDFALWFCEGGPHGDYFDFYESDDEWLDSMMYFAKRGVEDHNMGRVMVKKMEQYNNYPIIYNQRQK